MKDLLIAWIILLAGLGVAAVVSGGEVGRAAQGRWEDVVKAAEKEGEVTVYATNSVGDLQVIWDAFKKNFLTIKLNSVAISTTSEIVTKVMAERRASQYLVDVVLGRAGSDLQQFAARQSARSRCRRRCCCRR